MHGNALDITNQKFGRLLALEPQEHTSRGIKWSCLCDCGNTTSVIVSSLRNGTVQSCGCLRKEILSKERPKSVHDLTGKVFGNLTVLSAYGRKIRQGGGTRVKWLCQCICGETLVVYTTNLTNGKQKNCWRCGVKARSESLVNDLTGKYFGDLLVLSREFSDHKDPGSYWLCKCVCGNQMVHKSGALLSGSVQRCNSCGKKRRADQLRKQNKTHGMTGTKEYNAMLVRKRNERKRNLDRVWNMYMEIMLHNTQPVCVVCGSTDRMETDHVLPLSKGHGLKPGNAVRLCKSCNSKKNNKLPEDLPEPMRSRILLAAEEFRFYWEYANE